MVYLDRIQKQKIMRKFYLVSSIVVGILILIMAFAQLGSTCSLYLLSSGSVTLVFLQVAGIGAVFGGLAVLYWKMPLPEVEDEEDAPPTVPPEKISTKIEEE